MKRACITVLLLLLIPASSCDKPTKGEQEPSNSDTSISSQASQKQIVLGQIIGPELRKAVEEACGDKVRGVGFVCRRDELYIFAIDFYTGEKGLMQPIMYLVGSVLMRKDGSPDWRLQIFAINYNDFITKYNRLNCTEQKSNKEDE
ncbi:MAG: hypothetical protein V7641_3625 [Blastocatellia bacterium]